MPRAHALVALILALCARTQGCLRPVPPAAGFPIQIDASLPITYGDGYVTFASMVRPTVPAPTCGWPLVAFVHPLGATRADDLNLQIAVAKQGYVVWSYDVRGQGQAQQANPSHPQAGTTLWGPIERCDLAEQLQHVAADPAYTGLVDASRIAVVGSSQGGSHAWSAAALSGQAIAVPGRPLAVMPVIACVVANDYAADPVAHWLPDGVLWGSWFVEALCGSFSTVLLDPTFVQEARTAFLAQDAAGLAATYAAAGRSLAGALATTQVPVLYTHSYHDRVGSPLEGVLTLAQVPAPHRLLLSTGGHNSPVNAHERESRDALLLRWLHRWLWSETNEVDVEEPATLAELPLDAAVRDDPASLWSHAVVADALAPSTQPRLFLHDDGSLDAAPAVLPQNLLPIDHVVDPLANFTPATYLASAATRDLANVLVACPLAEQVWSVVTQEERQLAAAARLHLRLVPQEADWMVAALLTVEPPAGPEVMLGGTCCHGEASTPGLAEDHDLVLPPVGVRIPAGSTIRVRLRNLWLREAPMLRQLEAAPKFHDFHVDVATDDGVGASWLDLPLAAVRPRIEADATWFDLSTAPPLSLHLRGGAARANLPYYITFGVSGHVPATPFLNDVMPLESDWLVGIVTSAWLQPGFTNFLFDLDGAGEATATVDLGAWAPLPPELTGFRLTFAAFVFDGLTVASGAATNPCDVMLR